MSDAKDNKTSAKKPITIPYPGLRPYQEEEKDNFYGRDKDCEILVDKLLANRLTLLFAASGVGKSSLLNAAVIPELKSPVGKNLPVVYHNDWVTNPIASMREALLASLRDSGKTGDAIPQESLTDLVRFYTLFSRHPLILILDQFEEFFRYQADSDEYRPFIKQLTDIVLDRTLSVSVCISMREDFALELNAFKPELPTVLFENFYRLEKLSEDATQQAILQPIRNAGYDFEGDLLDTLLKDLLSRELDRDPNRPVSDKREKTAEPPYLQIVCSQLWELDKADPEKLIRKRTYIDAGKAKGLLENYIQRELTKFSLKEKQYASKAFDHLISQRGTKMAYTADVLAHTVRMNKTKMQLVLDKLSERRILRSQKRQEKIWYELYHDMFSESLDGWNTRFKNRERNRKGVIWLSSAAVVVAGVFAGYDYWVNKTSYHLRSGNRPNDRLELYQGKLGSWDFFGQVKFLYETRFERKKLEPDKCVKNCDVYDYEKLNHELISNLSIADRVHHYNYNGSFDKSFELFWSIKGSGDPQVFRESLKYLLHSRNNGIKSIIRKSSLHWGENIEKNISMNFPRIGIKSVFKDGEIKNILKKKYMGGFLRKNLGWVESKKDWEANFEYFNDKELFDKYLLVGGRKFYDNILKFSIENDVGYDIFENISVVKGTKYIDFFIDELSNADFRYPSIDGNVNAVLAMPFFYTKKKLVDLLDSHDVAVRYASLYILNTLDMENRKKYYTLALNDLDKTIRDFGLEVFFSTHDAENYPMNSLDLSLIDGVIIKNLFSLISSNDQAEKRKGFNYLLRYLLLKVENAEKENLIFSDLIIDGVFSDNELVDFLESNFYFWEAGAPLFERAMPKKMTEHYLLGLSSRNGSYKYKSFLGLVNMKYNMDIDSISSILSINNSKSYDLFHVAIANLFDYKPEVVDLVISNAKGKNIKPNIRINNIKYLSSIEGEKVNDVLLDVAENDASIEIRMSALESLSNKEDENVDLELVNFLKKDNFSFDDKSKIIELLGVNSSANILKSLISHAEEEGDEKVRMKIYSYVNSTDFKSVEYVHDMFFEKNKIGNFKISKYFNYFYRFSEEKIFDLFLNDSIDLESYNNYLSLKKLNKYNNRFSGNINLSDINNFDLSGFVDRSSILKNSLSSEKIKTLIDDNGFGSLIYDPELRKEFSLENKDIVNFMKNRGANAYSIYSTYISDSFSNKDLLDVLKLIKPNNDYLALLGELAISVDDEGKISLINHLEEINGYGIVDILSYFLKSKNKALREKAAYALGKSGYYNSIPALIEAMDDGDVDVQVASIQALSMLEYENHLYSLSMLLESPHHKVRSAAAIALGNIGNPAKVDLLLNSFDKRVDAKDEILPDLVYSMRDVKSVDLENLLKKIIIGDGAYKELTAAAILTLGEIGSMGSVDFLIERLMDESWKMKKEVLFSIGRFKDRGSNVTITKEMVSSLFPISERQDYEAVIYSLSKILSVEDFENLVSNNFHIREKAGLLDYISTLERKAFTEKWLIEIIESNVDYGVKPFEYLGEAKIKSAIPIIMELLAELTEEWMGWRYERNILIDLVNKAKSDLDREIHQEKLNKHNINRPGKAIYLYTYAETMARIDPNEGIKLLNHPLAEARRGAWEGLARLADINLVKKLDKLRSENKENPIFHHALYRAIDMSLIHIEAHSKPEDCKAINNYMQNGVIDKKSVLPRLEWTRDRLDETFASLERVKFRIDHWFEEEWPDGPGPNANRPLCHSPVLIEAARDKASVHP